MKIINDTTGVQANRMIKAVCRFSLICVTYYFECTIVIPRMWLSLDQEMSKGGNIKNE